MTTDATENTQTLDDLRKKRLAASRAVITIVEAAERGFTDIDEKKRLTGNVANALTELSTAARAEGAAAGRIEGLREAEGHWRWPLVHAMRRDHEHRPQACDGCDSAEIVIRKQWATEAESAIQEES